MQTPFCRCACRCDCRVLLTIVLGIICFAGSADAQENRTNAAHRIYRDRVEAHWFENNNRFWYRLDLADNAREFVVVDALRATREPAFDHERLAQALRRQINDPGHA